MVLFWGCKWKIKSRELTRSQWGIAMKNLQYFRIPLREGILYKIFKWNAISIFLIILDCYRDNSIYFQDFSVPFADWAKGFDSEKVVAMH